MVLIKTRANLIQISVDLKNMSIFYHRTCEVVNTN